MTLDEMVLERMSKEDVFDLFIDGLINHKRGLITQHTFNRIQNIFNSDFSPKEIEELFKVDKSLPTMKEIFEEKVNPKTVLVDETGK